MTLSNLLVSLLALNSFLSNHLGLGSSLATAGLFLISLLPLCYLGSSFLICLDSYYFLAFRQLLSHITLRRHLCQRFPSSRLLSPGVFLKSLFTSGHSIFFHQGLLSLL